MISKAQMQTVEDKAVISGLYKYVSDRYVLLIMVGGVGGDFSQTGTVLKLKNADHDCLRRRLKTAVIVGY